MCVLVCVLLQVFDLVNAHNFCGRDRGASGRKWGTVESGQWPCGTSAHLRRYSTRAVGASEYGATWHTPDSHGSISTCTCMSAAKRELSCTVLC